MLLKSVSSHFSFQRDGQKREIMDRRTVCRSCGQVSYVGAQISEHELAVAAAIRDIEGLLSATEIQNIRLKYRFKQTDMEQMLSTGPKTWTRWERGKVPQSKAADKLIRLIGEDPEIASRLMEIAGVINPEAEAMFAQIELDAKRRNRVSIRAEMLDIFDASHEQLADRVADKAYELAKDARRGNAGRQEAA